MIQKRTMIFGSAQPSCSKWWWIGAMRKMRLRRQLEGATCPITDSASTTNTPPTMRSGISWRVITRRAERAAERERADVAHEQLRRVRVEPEEPDAGAGQRAAEDRELARARDERDREVLGDAARGPPT